MHVSHIIHIAGSPPDSAQRPSWNTLSHLDSVSWDTLPVELKKVSTLGSTFHINLTCLIEKNQSEPCHTTTNTTVPGCPVCRQFSFMSGALSFKTLLPQTSAPAPQTNPWFTVYPPHILMLSGFPPLSHVQTPKLSELSRTSLLFPRSQIPDVAKRSNESPQTPDTKRQKVSEKSSPALSPRPPGGGAGPVGQRPPSRQVLTPSVPPSTLPQPRPQLLQPSPIPPHATTTSAPSPAKPPAKPVAHPPSNAPNPNAPPTQPTFPPNVNMVVERGKALEIEIKVIEAKLQEAQSAGNAADVESLQMERVTKYQQARKIKTILYQIANRPAMGGLNSGAGGSGETPQSQSQSQPQPQPQLAASNIKSEYVVPLTVSAPVSAPMEEQKPVTDQKPPLTDQQALIHLMQARSGTTPYANPELAAQMHKLLNKTGIPGPTFSGSPQPRPAHPPASGSTSQHQSQPQSQPQASTSAIPGGPNQWEGSFTIQHAGQPKGFEVQVAAVMSSKGQPYVIRQFLWSSTNSLCSHTETWPERMFIDIPQGGPKDPPDLKSWLQKHHQSAVIAQFRPQARSIEQKKNDAAYNALMRIMMEARTASVPSILAFCHSY